MAGGGGNKKKYQYCTDSSGAILYLRVFQGHSGHFTGQCHYSGRFLQVHLSRWMCKQFTFHHQFGIDTRRSKLEQKNRRYSSRLWILWTKNTRILTRSTWKHRVLHNAFIKHGRNIKNKVYWVDINLALKSRFVLNVQRDGHRLQSIWIATCSCETSRKISCS